MNSMWETQSSTSEDVVSRNVKQDPFSVDIEQKAVDDAHLMNNTVRNFAWQGITVVVKDHKTKKPKAILENVDGFVEAGTSPIFCAAKGQPWTWLTLFFFN